MLGRERTRLWVGSWKKSWGEVGYAVSIFVDFFDPLIACNLVLNPYRHRVLCTLFRDFCLRFVTFQLLPVRFSTNYRSLPFSLSLEYRFHAMQREFSLIIWHFPTD